MDKVTLSPDESGYSFKDGIEVIRAQLTGGAGRFSRGILNAAILLGVQWTCDAEEYEYLRGVYRTHVTEGHAPFPIDLFIDSARFVEYQVRIIPGSFGLASHTGLQYVVKATLEVQPLPKLLSSDDLLKLMLPPDKDGYSFTDDAEVVYTELEGGLGRTRRDQIGCTTKINIQWTTNAAGFLYLRNFYRAWVVNPREGFPMDAFVDETTLSEFTAQFIPGSMQLSSVQGETFIVSAQIEVIQGEWPIGGPGSAGAQPFWLFFNRGDGTEPIHYDGNRLELTTPVPFEVGVGAVNDDGSGSNEQLITGNGLNIPLNSTLIPILGENILWNNLDAESPISYSVQEADYGPTDAWPTTVVNRQVYLTDFIFPGPFVDWPGGTLTMIAGDGIHATVVTFLPSSSFYPPLSIEYVEL